MFNESRLLKSTLIAAFSVSLLSGCDESLLSDAKQFNDIVVVSAQSIKKTYSGANDYARQCYITEIRFNPQTNIQHINSDGSPHPLLYLYDPADIRARELVVQGLLEYSAGLAAIAGSDAPEQAAKLASELATRLANTADSLNKLNESTKDSKGKNNFKFKEYSQPLSNLASVAAKAWVKKVQKDSLKKCIEEGYDDTEEAFDLLQKDLANLNHDCYELGAQLAILEEESYFNNKYGFIPEKAGKKPAADSPKFEQFSKIVADKERIALLNEIRDLGKNLAEIMASSPEPLLDNLRAAHKRLAKHLSPKFVEEKEREAKKRKEEEQQLEDSETQVVDRDDVKQQQISQKPKPKQVKSESPSPKRFLIPAFDWGDSDADLKQIAKGSMSGIFDAYKRVKVSLNSDRSE